MSRNKHPLDLLLEKFPLSPDEKELVSYVWGKAVAAVEKELIEWSAGRGRWKKVKCPQDVAGRLSVNRSEFGKKEAGRL